MITLWVYYKTTRRVLVRWIIIVVFVHGRLRFYHIITIISLRIDTPPARSTRRTTIAAIIYFTRLDNVYKTVRIPIRFYYFFFTFHIIRFIDLMRRRRGRHTHDRNHVLGILRYLQDLIARESIIYRKYKTNYYVYFSFFISCRRHHEIAFSCKNF